MTTMAVMAASPRLGLLLSCSTAACSPPTRRRRRGGESAAVEASENGGGGGVSEEMPSWRGRRSRWPEKITSASNPLVKHCVKLRLSSSYRRSSGSAVVVGLTPILEICRFQKLKDDKYPLVDCLLLLDGVEDPEELQDLYTPVVNVNPIVMKKVSGLDSIDSVEAIALMNIPKSFCNLDENENLCQHYFPSRHRILVLDGIQDPGNLGTLIRSAMAFKWDGVFLLPTCCDPFNEKALRAARGATFQLSIISGTWSHLMALKTEFKMKMLAGHPENSAVGSKRTFSLSQQLVESLAVSPLCLVLGSEGHGPSEQTLHLCDLVSIPMAGSFESLNVSVAGGIFLFMFQPKPHILIG